MIQSGAGSFTGMLVFALTGVLASGAFVMVAQQQTRMNVAPASDV